MKVQRYSPVAEYIGTGDYIGAMSEDNDGDWVMYERIADLERQLAAMKPVVDAALLYAKYNDIDSGRDLMDVVSDYESRKQP